MQINDLESTSGPNSPRTPDVVVFNVGGEKFETLRQTASLSPYLARLIDPERYGWTMVRGGHPEAIFIDRCPNAFREVLNYLRDPSYPFPPIYNYELAFYGLEPIEVAPPVKGDDYLVEKEVATALDGLRESLRTISGAPEYSAQGAILSIIQVTERSSHHWTKQPYTATSQINNSPTFEEDGWVTGAVHNTGDLITAIELVWKSPKISQCDLVEFALTVGGITVVTWNYEVLRMLEEESATRSDHIRSLNTYLSERHSTKSLTIPIGIPYCSIAKVPPVSLSCQGSIDLTQFPLCGEHIWKARFSASVMPSEVCAQVKWNLYHLPFRTDIFTSPFSFQRSFQGKGDTGGDMDGLTFCQVIVCEGDPGDISISLSGTQVMQAQAVHVLKDMMMRGCWPREMVEGGKQVFHYRLDGEGIAINRCEDARVTFQNPVKRWWYAGSVVPDLIRSRQTFELLKGEREREKATSSLSQVAE